MRQLWARIGTPHLFEAERLVGDLKQDLDTINGRYNGLGQHTRQPAGDDPLECSHHVVAVVLRARNETGDRSERNQPSTKMMPATHARQNEEDNFLPP